MAVDRLDVLGHGEGDDARDDDLILPVDKGPGKGEGGINVSVLMRRIARLEAQHAGAVSLLDDVTDVLARVIGPEPPKSAEIDAVLRRALAERHLRGQSETPAASDENRNDRETR